MKLQNNSVFIVGISSFVGSNIALYLKSQGMKVSGSFRNNKLETLKDLETHKIDLINNSVLPKLGNFEWVIYCAHDIKLEQEIQIKAYENLFKTLSTENTNHIFISSISSSEQAVSVYGKTKFSLEQFFAKKNAFILRPGLIIGKGGLFLRMYNNILTFPITPLIDGGRTRVEFIGIEDLCIAIKFIINNKPEKKTFNLISNKKIDLYYLSKTIRNNSKKLFIPISIPIFFVDKAVTILNFFKIPSPITKENLLGLKTNSKNDFTSDLNRVSIKSPSDFGIYLEKMMNISYSKK